MSFKDTLISLKLKAENLLSKDVGDAADSLEDLQTKSKALRTNLKSLEDQKTLIKQFQTQTLAVEKNEAAFKSLSDRAVTLRKRIQETGDPTGQFAVQLERTETAAKKSAASLLTKQTVLNKVSNGLNKANINTNDLLKSEAKLNNQIEKSKSVLGKFATQMRSVGTETKAVEETSKSFSFVKAAYWTGGIVGITTFLTKIKSLTLEMLTTGDKFEGLSIQMNALMGSIEEGERATEWIKAFTQNTPLQLEQVTETFARLKSFGLDPMDGSMQAIVDASEKLGGGMERVSGISLALGQAWAKQKLQGEEILQLVERGVPVWDLLEKATGRNALELQKLSSEGKLGKDVIKQLTAEIGKSAEGAAAANMGRLTGLVSNLKDQWQLFLNQVADSGALDYAKSQLALLNNTIKEMAADGSLKKWAQDISDTLIRFVEGVKSSAEWLYKFKDAIIAVGETALKIKLAQMFIGFGVAAAKAVTSLFAVNAATVATTASVKVLSNALKASLVGAVVFTATQVYRLVDAWKDMKSAEDAATESAKLAKDTTIEKAEKLKALSTQLGINISSMEEFLALEEKGVIIFDKTTDSYVKSNEQLAKQTQLQKQNAEVLENATIPTAERLKLKFEELQREGSNAVYAISDIAKAIDVGDQTSLVSLIDTLKILKDQGQITSADIETGLRIQLKNLNDKELAALKLNAPDTFAALGVSIQSVANEVDPLRALFTLLDVDLNELRGGFTETGSSALSAFQSISESANASSTDIIGAFDGVFKKIKTSSEFDALKIKVLALGEAGKLSGDQLEAMLSSLDEQITDLTPGVNSLEEAYKNLGIESKKSLDKANQSLKDSYELIKNSNAPIEEKKAAFLAYSTAAISANNGVVSSEIKVQAAIAGVSLELKDQNATIKDNTEKWVNRAALIKDVNADITNSLSNQNLSTNSAGSSNSKTFNAVFASADSTDLSSLSDTELQEKAIELYERINKNRNVSSSGFFSSIAKSQIEFDNQTLTDIAQLLQEKALDNMAQTTASYASQQAAAKSNTTTSVTSEITKTVNLKLNIGGDSITVPTTTQGSDDLISLLKKNALVTA